MPHYGEATLGDAQHRFPRRGPTDLPEKASAARIRLAGAAAFDLPGGRPLCVCLPERVCDGSLFDRRRETSV